jgi:hypothetical protein
MMAMHVSRVSLTTRVTRTSVLAVLLTTMLASGATGTASGLQLGPTPVSCNGTMTPSGVCLIPPLTVTDTLPTIGPAARAITATPTYVG